MSATTRTGSRIARASRSPRSVHTGLQREVISLYRSFLRMVRSKPEPARPQFFAHVSSLFRAPPASTTSPRDVVAIEVMLRQGKKRLEMLRNPSVESIGGVPSDGHSWYPGKKLLNLEDLSRPSQEERVVTGQ
ncbi:hypothetical protein M427DRAFT_51160 [Gonapodya prolifera JEL478]|uniref:Complex 1 LYR protein domain-containing protein n=1 Tax=Gonapodya prolifera (strain JEL478) TaxID=1344416 RepID=A0A139AYK1_GONPJ|nr:hypothetical protein M427DRAFT_51160 [Gonapodya prolifera JEL478]|eukprot:KXS21780.1 hypothetical protein M427DRAFT_51160 [Gonapodya prolifera JEL478]